jgi:molybdopterin converting factor small subunit
MSVIFHIPGPLVFLTEGQRRVEIDAAPANLREAIDLLCSRYPAIRDRILTEQHQVREHVNLFVGNEEMRHLDGLATPLSPRTEITIMQAVSGGLGETRHKLLNTESQSSGAHPAA